MNLDQLPALLKRLEQVDALLKRLEDHEARYSAIETGMMEHTAALSELVELQSKQIELLTQLVTKDKGDKSEGDEYAPLIEAIKSIKLPAPTAAPVVKGDEWTTLRVSIPQGEDRPARTMTITKAK